MTKKTKEDFKETFFYFPNGENKKEEWLKIKNRLIEIGFKDIDYLDGLLKDGIIKGIVACNNDLKFFGQSINVPVLPFENNIEEEKASLRDLIERYKQIEIEDLLKIN